MREDDGGGRRRGRSGGGGTGSTATALEGSSGEGEASTSFAATRRVQRWRRRRRGGDGGGAIGAPSLRWPAARNSNSGDEGAREEEWVGGLRSGGRCDPGGAFYRARGAPRRRGDVEVVAAVGGGVGATGRGDEGGRGWWRWSHGVVAHSRRTRGSGRRQLAKVAVDRQWRLLATTARRRRRRGRRPCSGSHASERRKRSARGARSGRSARDPTAEESWAAGLPRGKRKLGRRDSAQHYLEI